MKRATKGAPSKRPPVPYDLVIVEWEDSAQPSPTWQWVKDYEFPSIVRCTSVGYLIAQTRDAIAIAPNLGDLAREQIQASGIMRIPASAVRKIYRV